MIFNNLKLSFSSIALVLVFLTVGGCTNASSRAGDACVPSINAKLTAEHQQLRQRKSSGSGVWMNETVDNVDDDF